LYYDGTKGDLKRAILEARRDYDKLRAGALATTLPDRVKIVTQYETMFRKVLSEVQGD
jgi:hypothetical protein